MYITINYIKAEKRIDLSYPVKNSDSSKETLDPLGVAQPQGPHSVEIAVIGMLSDNVQYQIRKPHTIIRIFQAIKN